VIVPSLVNGGLLTYTFYGNVAGAPLSIVNTALIELPADTTVEDPTPGNNSATDTDLADNLFANGFEDALVNAPNGRYVVPGTALRGVLDAVAVPVYTLDDARGEALRVYARVFDGQLQYALATRNDSGQLRLSAWASFASDPTLTWHAHAFASGWILDSAELQ
jgi:hypothetical protein